ncbi:MAG: cation:proton antiporter [Flavobacteriales bacterium]|nr:cation:proton antiporter [Flavobacteriales bacterium]MCB9193561.1 cation:proton antiporter [Flavobacteriales bacterium]
MQHVDPYIFIIAASITVIASHLFNLLARRTNIPSVLMLIGAGIGLHYALRYFTDYTPGPLLFGVMNVLGIAGLIMIVLEAALDLELRREKVPLILKAFGVALFSLAATLAACAWTIQRFIVDDWYTALVYATPLSIMSSAIVLPSVSGLVHEKREFMVYEATFSDILGIMLFYFLVDDHTGKPAAALAAQITGSVLLTVVVSILVSVAVVWVFQRIRTRIKFFLLIAVLMLLYAIGKKLNLSSLLIILVFGLMVKNHALFFRGTLHRLARPSVMRGILNELHLITGETSFLVRTFFFIVFGMTMDLTALFSPYVVLVSALLIVVIYGIRLISLLPLHRRHMMPELTIAPRGLVTILLFYNIPDRLVSPSFDNNVLFFIILASNLVMMFGLITTGQGKDLSVTGPDVLLPDERVPGAVDEPGG